MKLFKSIIAVFSITLLLLACNTSPSLQKYYVDSKENTEFMSVDLPASLLQLKTDDVSEKVQKTMATIKKINFLSLKLTSDNNTLFLAEKEKVSRILKNHKYKELMRFKHGNAAVKVIFLGQEDAIDEVVFFGFDNAKGFALARVVGDNMNPADILQMAQSIKLDNNTGELKQLGSLFGQLK